MSGSPLKKFFVRVLVVDDYIVNLELSKEMLEMMNCQVDTAESSKEALELCRQNKYDIIFMDVQIPDIDGMQVAQEIRHSELPSTHAIIIALTANASQSDAQKCLEAGMNAYLTKPVKIKDLEGILTKFIT